MIYMQIATLVMLFSGYFYYENKVHELETDVRAEKLSTMMCNDNVSTLSKRIEITNNKINVLSADYDNAIDAVSSAISNSGVTAVLVNNN